MNFAASKLAICRIQMFPLFTPAAFLFPPIELIEVYKFRSTPNSVSFDFGSHRCHVERMIKKKRLVLFFSLISPPFLPLKSFPSKMLSNSRSLFVVKMNLSILCKAIILIKSEPFNVKSRTGPMQGFFESKLWRIIIW